MGDIVTSKCVLARRKDASNNAPDRLYLEAKGIRILPCHPKGEPRRHPVESGPEWEYEERDGKLHLTPSMLCTATGFHTDFHWSVDYEGCPEGVGGYEHFLSLNPGADEANR